MPKRRPKLRRLGLNDGSCGRLRPERRNEVCCYDFVQDRTPDGWAFRMLTLIDEYIRERPSTDVARQLASEDVLERLGDLFVHRSVPEHLQSDNCSEFTARRARQWRERFGMRTRFIGRGSPWENGYVESFHEKLRDELLEREGLQLALGGKGADRTLADRVRPSPAAQLARRRPPAPEAIAPVIDDSATLPSATRGLAGRLYT